MSDKELDHAIAEAERAAEVLQEELRKARAMANRTKAQLQRLSTNDKDAREDDRIKA